MSGQKNPRQNRLREALGRVYEHYPPYFQEHLRQFREDPKSRVFAALADAYRKMGQLEEAMAVCAEGLKHHPDFPGGRVALARCYMEKKNWGLAREQLERVVQVAPENLLAQRLLGEIHSQLGDPENALHCLRMALLLAPQDVELAEKVRQLERRLLTAPESETPVVVAAPAPQVQAPVPASPAASVVVSVSPEAESGPESAEDNWQTMSLPQTEEDPEEDPERSAEIEKILGADEAFAEGDAFDGESFQVAPVSAVLKQEMPAQRAKEITTETLGDLYFAQGQFEKSLRIYEKIASGRNSSELVRKMNLCRASLGVDPESLLRKRKIEALRGVLKALNA